MRSSTVIGSVPGIGSLPVHPAGIQRSSTVWQMKSTASRTSQRPRSDSRARSPSAFLRARFGKSDSGTLRRSRSPNPLTDHVAIFCSSQSNSGSSSQSGMPSHNSPSGRRAPIRTLNGTSGSSGTEDRICRRALRGMSKVLQAVTCGTLFHDSSLQVGQGYYPASRGVFLMPGEGLLAVVNSTAPNTYTMSGQVMSVPAEMMGKLA